MFKVIVILIIFLNNSSAIAKGYDVYGIGLYDIKFDENNSNNAIDFRYERRFDKSIFNIGPESQNFFYLKPFIGIESTSDSALYAIGGVYLEDNIGALFSGEESNILVTPSFGLGYYEDGNGKKLGNKLEFRSTIELSYQLVNNNRIGFSMGHISNANIGKNNPGVEIFGISYQVPFN